MNDNSDKDYLLKSLDNENNSSIGNLNSKLIKSMKNVEFHFALEGISGKGKNFLLESIKESKLFKQAKKIDSTKSSWSELFEMIKK